MELKHIKDSSITSDPQKAIEYVKTKFPEDKRFKGSTYYNGVHNFYCRNRMHKKKLEEEISSTISEAYTAAQPRPHIFEVTIEN